MCKITPNVSQVKIEIEVKARTSPGYTIQQRGRKTIITINDGEIVITLKPP